MKFNESGLPQSKIIENAFEYSQAYLMSFEGKSLNNFEIQVEAARKAKMASLEKKRLSGELSDLKSIEAEKDINEMMDDQIARGPKLIKDKLEENFEDIFLAKAKILVDHADGVSDDLLAAALLIECAHNSEALQKIEDKFGKAVSAVISEARDIDSDPKTSKLKLYNASPSFKRLYEASLISKVAESRKKIEEIKKKSPKVKLALGQEQLIFDSAKTVWGNDSGLDKEFFGSFKEFLKFTNSDYSLSINKDGNMALNAKNVKSSNDNTSKLSGLKKPNPGAGSFKF